MKKLLFAVKNMNIGGVEKSLLSLLNTVDRTQYEVDLLLLENYGGFMAEIPDWVNVIICDDYAKIRDEVNLPPVSVIRQYIKDGHVIRGTKLFVGLLLAKLTNDYSWYYKAVFSHVKKLPSHYDVAISYTSIIGYLTWFVDYHIDADKYVGWIHFDISKLTVDRKLLLRLHQNMAKIYVVSQAALDAFVELFPQLKNQCELRYNVIDQNRILQMAQEPVESIREDGTKTIVTLGRLTAEKGQDIIPDVAVKLKESGVRFKWYLIGEGGLRKAIEEKSKALGVENEVVLLGTKTNPYPYLKQADIYVQTSIHEGFCITLGEAKVFGMPIVSTEFAGAHEQLDEVEKAVVVKRNADEIAVMVLKTAKE